MPASTGVIAAEIMKAVESRSQRLEGSISKSIADKYGMTMCFTGMRLFHH